MNRDLLSEELFPKVEFCFAYGSGAVIQDNYKKDEAKMLDLVFVVENPLEWHKQNIENNPHHYASHMKAIGPSFITHVQDGYCAGMYYNTLIPMRSYQNRSMKYGVISRKELELDLSSWHTLYLAGRLHKPVVFMSEADDSLSAMLRLNLSNAVKTSLYLLPEKFTKYELYLSIAGLSYSGDFRMIFGENPDKVKNIVTPNVHLFDKLYANVLTEMSDNIDCGANANDQCFQNMSPNSRLQLYNSLPRILLPKVPAVEVESASVIKARLQSIVMKSSFKQSAKGMLTAGPFKSVSYTGAKISKWISGWGKRMLK